MENMESIENNEIVQEVGTATPANEGKSFSVAALVLGILGIVGAWAIGNLLWIPILGVFLSVCVCACAILGIIFGVKGRQMSVAANGKASGLATAGLVLGIIGTVFSTVGLLCSGCVTALCSVAGM